MYWVNMQKILCVVLWQRVLLGAATYLVSHRHFWSNPPPTCILIAVHVSQAHNLISCFVLFHSAQNAYARRQRAYVSKSKVAPSCRFRFCDSLTIQHVPRPVPGSCPAFYPGRTVMFLSPFSPKKISHSTSRLDFKPHPHLAKPVLDSLAIYSVNS